MFLCSVQIESIFLNMFFAYRQCNLQYAKHKNNSDPFDSKGLAYAINLPSLSLWWWWHYYFHYTVNDCLHYFSLVSTKIFWYTLEHLHYHFSLKNVCAVIYELWMHGWPLEYKRMTCMTLPIIPKKKKSLCFSLFMIKICFRSSSMFSLKKPKGLPLVKNQTAYFIK